MLIVPLVQYGFGVIAGPIWMRIGYRLGKSRTLIVAELTQIVYQSRIACFCRRASMAL